jgi:hypothetical protein
VRRHSALAIAATDSDFSFTPLKVPAFIFRRYVSGKMHPNTATPFRFYIALLRVKPPNLTLDYMNLNKPAENQILAPAFPASYLRPV